MRYGSSGRAVFQLHAFRWSNLPPAGVGREHSSWLVHPLRAASEAVAYVSPYPVVLPVIAGPWPSPSPPPAPLLPPAPLPRPSFRRRRRPRSRRRRRCCCRRRRRRRRRCRRRADAAADAAAADAAAAVATAAALTASARHLCCQSVGPFSWVNCESDVARSRRPRHATCVTRSLRPATHSLCTALPPPALCASRPRSPRGPHWSRSPRRGLLGALQRISRSACEQRKVPLQAT